MIFGFIKNVIEGIKLVVKVVQIIVELLVAAFKDADESFTDKEVGKPCTPCGGDQDACEDSKAEPDEAYKDAQKQDAQKQKENGKQQQPDQAGGEQQAQEKEDVSAGKDTEEAVEEKKPENQPSALTTYNGSNFMNKTVVADVEFVAALKRINGYAKARDVKVYVTDSFRESGRKVNGAIVTPAKKSNHLAGHAIDMNLQHDKKHYNSKKLKKSNLKNLPAAVKGFIEDIQNDSGLRWGGDWSREDPVHIDDHLNGNMSQWDARYKATQKARENGEG